MINIKSNEDNRDYLMVVPTEVKDFLFDEYYDFIIPRNVEDEISTLYYQTMENFLKEHCVG